MNSDEQQGFPICLRCQKWFPTSINEVKSSKKIMLSDLKINSTNSLTGARTCSARSKLASGTERCVVLGEFFLRPLYKKS